MCVAYIYTYELYLELHVIVTLRTVCNPSLPFESNLLFVSLQRKRVAGGKEEMTMQPMMRWDYNPKIGGGADTADQQNGSNTHDHKSCSNHWRRVIYQKAEQSCTDGFL